MASVPKLYPRQKQQFSTDKVYLIESSTEVLIQHFVCWDYASVVLDCVVEQVCLICCSTREQTRSFMQIIESWL